MYYNYTCKNKFLLRPPAHSIEIKIVKVIHSEKTVDSNNNFEDSVIHVHGDTDSTSGTRSRVRHFPGSLKEFSGQLFDCMVILNPGLVRHLSWIAREFWRNTVKLFWLCARASGRVFESGGPEFWLETEFKFHKLVSPLHPRCDRTVRS